MLKAALSIGQRLDQEISIQNRICSQSLLRRAICTNTAIQRGIRRSSVRRNEGKDRSRYEEVRGTNYAAWQKPTTKKLPGRSREFRFERQQKQDTHVGKKARRVRDEHGKDGSRNLFSGSDSRSAQNQDKHSLLKKDSDRFSGREESFRAQVRDHEDGFSLAPAETMGYLPRNRDGSRDPLLEQSKRGSYRRQRRDIESRSPPLPSNSSNKLARAKKRAAANGLGNGVSNNVLDYSAVQGGGDEDTTARSSHLIKDPDQRESFIRNSNPRSKDKLRGEQSSRYDKPREVSLQNPNDWGLGKAKSNAPLSIPYTTPASEFLYGTSVIASALEAQRRKLYKLYIYDGEDREIRAQERSIRKLALTRGVEVVKVKGSWLRLMDKMSNGRPHNGYILEASPLPKLPVTGLQSVPERKASFHVSISYQSHEEKVVNGTDTSIKAQHAFSRYPFILLLDGILDPGNLGAVLRTAFFLGADAVAISSRNSAPLSPVTLKASAGSCEALPILSVSHVANFIDDARKNSWKFYAATAPVKPGMMPSFPTKKRPAYYSTSTLRDPTQNYPCVLMLGAEGEGLRSLLLKKADFLVGVEGNRVGQNGVDSLNVSVAAGLLCDAFLRRPAQQNPVIRQPIISEPSSSLSYGPPEQMETVAAISEISTPDSSPGNNSSGTSAPNNFNGDNINADADSPLDSNSDAHSENVEVSGTSGKDIGGHVGADREVERLF